MDDRASDLPALSIRRPWLVIVINLLIVIAGVGAWLGVEVRELPNIDRPIVAVRADYPGAAPETIDAEVTRVVEGAAARVPGVFLVRSASEEGNFRVIIEFNPGVDLVGAANDVRDRVSRAMRNQSSRVTRVWPASGSRSGSSRCRIGVCVVIAQLSGGAPPAAVRRSMKARSASSRSGGVIGSGSVARMRSQTSVARWFASRAPRSVQVPKLA